MSVEYKFENPDDYFLLKVDRLVDSCLEDANLRKSYVEILRINKNALNKINAKRGSIAFVKSLIGKIDYLLKLEEGE